MFYGLTISESRPLVYIGDSHFKHSENASDRRLYDSEKQFPIKKIASPVRHWTGEACREDVITAGFDAVRREQLGWAV
jgi:hypothetical protein